MSTMRQVASQCEGLERRDLSHSNKDVLRRTGFNFQSGGNNNQELYYEKYLKYKNKYNQLKKSI